VSHYYNNVVSISDWIVDSQTYDLLLLLAILIPPRDISFSNLCCKYKIFGKMEVHQ
jgi:hypothetical protein